MTLSERREALLADATAEIEALAKRVWGNVTWSTGTGTKASHAQIIASSVRRHSFYATADTEAEALRLATAELAAALRARAQTPSGGEG